MHVCIHAKAGALRVRDGVLLRGYLVYSVPQCSHLPMVVLLSWASARAPGLALRGAEVFLLLRVVVTQRPCSHPSHVAAAAAAAAGAARSHASAVHTRSRGELRVEEAPDSRRTPDSAPAGTGCCALGFVCCCCCALLLLLLRMGS